MLFSLVSMAVLASSLRIEENARLKVVSPPSLVKDFKDGDAQGVISGTPAMFGNFAWGGTNSISGELYYPQLQNDEQGCTEFSKEEIDLMEAKKQESRSTRIIVLVDRGDCPFVTKVRDAEKAGAAAVIVADNVREMGGRLPYMADDNTGGSINVQSILIDYDDGQKLKAAIKDSDTKGNVFVKFVWNLPHPDGRVEYDLFTTSEIGLDSFKLDFAPVAKQLGDKALFTPHYEFVDGSMLRCTENGGTLCGNQCTNKGRYCHYDPEEELDIGFSGAQIVRENVRQKCMYLHVNSTDQHVKWFDYVTEFESSCNTQETFNEECSYKIMEKIDGAVDAVKKCITDNGGYGDEDGVNALIQSELDNIFNLNIFSWPTLLVNQRPVRGSLNCATKNAQTRFNIKQCSPLEIICTGYAKGTEPDVCKAESGHCPIGEILDDCHLCGGGCFGCKKDKCGACMHLDDPDFSKGCLDCAGTPNGLKKIDSCDVCGGPDRDICGFCPVEGRAAPKSQEDCSAGAEKFPVWGVVLIVVGCVLMVGGGVFCYMRRREDAMRQDIDSLLKQYLPMGDQPVNADE